MIERPIPTLRVGLREKIGPEFVRWLSNLILKLPERHTPTEVQDSAYTAALWDMVMCDPSGGGFTVTLPDSRREPPCVIVIKNTVNSANAITLAAATGDQIEGGAGASISAGYGSLVMASDHLGTGWWSV
jgi:hypothetical protein